MTKRETANYLQEVVSNAFYLVTALRSGKESHLISGFRYANLVESILIMALTTVLAVPTRYRRKDILKFISKHWDDQEFGVEERKAFKAAIEKLLKSSNVTLG